MGKTKKKKETRQEKYLYVGGSIMEASMSTKRKAAFLKITINDDLARKLMKQQVFLTRHEDGFPTITGLALTYSENLTPIKKHETSRIKMLAGVLRGSGIGCETV